MYLIETWHGNTRTELRYTKRSQIAMLWLVDAVYDALRALALLDRPVALYCMKLAMELPDGGSIIISREGPVRVTMEQIPEINVNAQT